jgi:hypothetical protein
MAMQKAFAHCGTRLTVGETLFPCGGCGLSDAAKDLQVVLMNLSKLTPTLVLQATTGSGKSKWLPSWIARMGTTLVFTPSRIDVSDMASRATVPCSWQIGGEPETGHAYPLLRIFSSGVACKKNLSGQLLRDASFIIFDEVDVCNTDCSYAWLFECCVKEAKSRTATEPPLRIVLTSASPGAAALALVTSGEALYFQYEGRCHVVETARLTCLSAADATASFIELAAALCKNGDSCILNCLGEAEVAHAVKELQSLHVFVEGAHSKMDPLELAAALTVKQSSRVLCATALVDRGITLSDMTWVLDSGLARRSNKEAGVEEFIDGFLDAKGSMQRRGRVGRVRPGAYVLATFPDASVLEEQAGVDSALEAFAAGMGKGGARLCSLSDTVKGEAMLMARSLFSSRQECLDCYRRLPVSVTRAAAIQAAAKNEEWTARWEVSGLVALLESGACKGRVDVRLALRVMQGGDICKEHFMLRRVLCARKLHSEICRRESIKPSSMHEEHLLEAIALSFLRTHLELGIRRSGTVHIAGYAVQSPGPDGPVVLVDLRKNSWGAVRATFELPATAWVLMQSSLAAPLQTAAVIGDSTFQGFRLAAFFALRRLNLDIVHWHQRAGARETELAVQLLKAPLHDVLFCACNGNQMMRARVESEAQSWMQPAMADLAAAASQRSRRVAFFVGDANLSPGVWHPETYGRLVPQLQEHLRRAGCPVVTRFPSRAVALQLDGFHWDASDVIPIQELFEFMEQEARAPPPVLQLRSLVLSWEWAAMDGIHYPFCVLCNKWMDENHLHSKAHHLKGGVDAVSFELKLCRGRHFTSEAARISPFEADALMKETAARLSILEAPPTPPLPTGWGSASCPDTGVMYFYSATGVVQWEHPVV